MILLSTVQVVLWGNFSSGVRIHCWTEEFIMDPFFWHADLFQLADHDFHEDCRTANVRVTRSIDVLLKHLPRNETASSSKYTVLYVALSIRSAYALMSSSNACCSRLRALCRNTVGRPGVEDATFSNMLIIGVMQIPPLIKATGVVFASCNTKMPAGGLISTRSPSSTCLCK